MSLFRRIFSRQKEISAAAAKIDEMTYLLNYERHYGEALTGFAGLCMRAGAPAELYLFRGWATQFGYRIFTADAISNRSRRRP